MEVAKLDMMRNKSVILTQGTRVDKIRSLKRILQNGQTSELLHLVKERWKSELVSFGLRRDVTIPFAAPDASIPVKIRPLEEGDIPKILDVNSTSITDEGRAER